MKRILSIFAIALSASISLGCTPKPETLSGDLILPGTASSNVSDITTREKFGGECTGFDATAKNELAGIKSGAQIQVKDVSGKLVATGTLGVGKIVDLTALGACSFSFSVANIPASNFYTIEVGNQKGLSFSVQDLKAKNWRVKLLLASETLADGADLDPATEQDKAARRLRIQLQEATAKVEERTEQLRNELQTSRLCRTQWRLYSEYANGKPLSKECREWFIKENGKTPEVAKAEYYRSLGL